MRWLFCILVLFSSCSFSAKTTRKKWSAARAAAPFDAIIVPGVPLENGQWSRTMKGRVYWAKYLYDQGITRHIIFGGAAVYTPYVEAEVMKQYALALGLPEDKLFTETQAEHSTENVYYGYQLAKAKGFTRIALASDPFQTKLLRRFVRKKVDPQVQLIPFVMDTLKMLAPAMTDPVIDFSSMQRSPFVPITERESFWQRWRGTRGKNIDYGKNTYGKNAGDQK